MAVEIKLVLKDGEQQRVDRVLEHLAEKAKDVNGPLNCSMLENTVKPQHTLAYKNNLVQCSILENAVKLKRFYYN